MSGFVLYPALDLRGGRVVRLQQGDYARETGYAGDALVLARAYAEAGAGWLHLVDLDAARTGRYSLGPLVGTIKARTGLRVQTGGGVRSERDLVELLSVGADRVVIGSLAVREPGTVSAWLHRYGPERITLALDARCDDAGVWRLPTAGWTRQGAEELHSLVASYAAEGLRHLLCTDIERDGMLGGPNLSLYARLCRDHPALAVQASGGVAGAADVAATRAVGCAGLVVGRALLEGRLRLADAYAVAQAC